MLLILLERASMDFFDDECTRIQLLLSVLFLLILALAVLSFRIDEFVVSVIVVDLKVAVVSVFLFFAVQASAVVLLTLGVDPLTLDKFLLKPPAFLQ
jgi:hypothetical protein